MLFYLANVNLKRKKRQVPVEVTPIAAVVELVMIVDYSLWHKMSSENITADGANNHMLNVLLYFGHITAMVSIY